MTKSVFGSRAAEGPGPTYSTASRTLQVAEDLVPIAQLKARLSEIVRGLDARPRPLIVTLNGKAAAVVMSPREFDRLTHTARFLGAVRDGIADADAGRTIDDREMKAGLERRFGRKLRVK
jgi:prevent-host-death family protein